MGFNVPGFYLVGGEVIAVGYDVREPSVGELREVVVFLDELASRFNHVLDRFATIVKWGVMAPFIYVYKQMGTWVPWLFLYGYTMTGKSTLAEIVLRIWNLVPEVHDYKTINWHWLGGGCVDSPAKMGYILSRSTFPIVVEWPAGALAKGDVIDVVKRAVEGLVARRRCMGRRCIDELALAPLVFVGDRLPRDVDLLRRLIVLVFTRDEKIPREKAEEFDRTVKPRLKVLKTLGEFTAHHVMSEGLPEDPYELPDVILKSLYKRVGLEIPKWIRAYTLKTRLRSPRAKLVVD